ncbi:MAG: calcium-binding protein [Pseudolabrys sp.]
MKPSASSCRATRPLPIPVRPRIATTDVILIGAGGTGSNIAMGGGGNDTITIAASGNNFALGDSGSVTATVGLGGSLVTQYVTTVDNVGAGEEQLGGDDTIDLTGNGDNVVMGGAGHDTVTVTGGGNNNILGDLGIMQVVSGGFDLVGHNTAYGNGNTDWDDVIKVLGNAGTGNNTIMGNAGNDFIDVESPGLYTHSGNNVIFGDSGEVNPSGAQTIEQADGGADTITIGVSAGGDNTILGGAARDVITVQGDGDNSIFGDMGSVIPVNGVTPDLHGRDTTIGTGDLIAIELGADGNNVVIAEAGNDTITSSGLGLNVLMGDTGDVTHQQIGDRLYPKLVTSTEIGVGGNDTITATLGNTVMVGGTGSDKLTGGLGPSYILGDDGEVTFSPEVAQTHVPKSMYSTHFEDGSDDVINTGDATYAFAIGGTGQDTINGGAGNDSMAGDQAEMDWNPDGTRQRFTTVDSDPVGGARDTIIGHGGNNNILGGEDGDYLEGGPGSNVIIGDGGHVFFTDDLESMAETLNQFRDGPDTIVAGGGPGRNFLFGGGPEHNFFIANPLNDLIFNTDGHVDITPERTGRFSLPPFLGNALVSMVGNWFAPITEGLVGGVDTLIAGNQYYTGLSVFQRLHALHTMQMPAPATFAEPGSFGSAPGSSPRGQSVAQRRLWKRPRELFIRDRPEWLDRFGSQSSFRHPGAGERRRAG